MNSEVQKIIDNSPAHKEALADKEKAFSSWTYNVRDELKHLSPEEIKRKLQIEALPYAVCMTNIIGDFNFGTLVRNANAFGAKEIFYFGNKKIDRRAMTGVQHYSPVNYLPTLEQLKNLKQKYTFVGIDNVSGAKSIRNFDYPSNPLFLFGEEGCGIPQDILNLCDSVVEIPQMGSVRSINVGCASSIIMNDYVQYYSEFKKILIHLYEISNDISGDISFTDYSSKANSLYTEILRNKADKMLLKNEAQRLIGVYTARKLLNDRK